MLRNKWEVFVPSSTRTLHEDPAAPRGGSVGRDYVRSGAEQHAFLSLEEKTADDTSQTDRDERSGHVFVY